MAVVDGLRPHWLPQIVGIEGAPVDRVNDWVGRGQYYFDQPVGPSAVSFVLQPGATLVEIFASEMSRFCSAAIETSVGITRGDLPKSLAWLVIQTYYASFFAAHAILRCCGIAVSNFVSTDSQRADAIATALGYSTSPLAVAQFRCEYQHGNARLECIKAQGGGIHEQFWRVFDAFLTSVSTQVLSDHSLVQSDAQTIFGKLEDLQRVLRSDGHSGGNWLSSIRNEVNYRQQHQTWFPYGRSRSECDHLFKLHSNWRSVPDSISFNARGNSDLERFVLVCSFLVSLSIDIAKDMARRGPTNSFLKAGPIRLLSQMNG